MAQSLSGGSGSPSRMTLTLICLFRESWTMRDNYSMHRRVDIDITDYADVGEHDTRFCGACYCGSPTLRRSSV